MKQLYTLNSLQITSIDLILLVYLAYLLLKLLFYPVDTEYILTITGLTACYYLFRHIPKQGIVILLCLLPVLAVVQIIYGYNHFEYPWQSLSDITGIFNNTGIFGGFVAIGVISALGFMFTAKRTFIRIVFGVILIPLTIQLIYCQSRAAWVAVVAGILIFSLPVFHKLTIRKNLMVILFLIMTGILFASKLYYLKKDSADGRLLIWTVSWNLIKHKPLTGFGPDGFTKNYLLWQGEYFREHSESLWADLADDSAYPFNEFLKTGVEQGIIGLLFMTGIILFALVKTTSFPVLQAVLAGLVGFSCFSYPFGITTFQILGVLCLAGIVRQTSVIATWGNPLKNGAMKLSAVCLIIISCASVLIYSGSYYANVKKWNQTIRSLTPDNDNQVAGLQALYPAFRNNGRFLLVYGKLLCDAGRYSEAIPLLEASKDIFPRTQVWILLGESYENTGAYSNALTSWETASYIKPSLFTPHYNMAKLYSRLQYHEQAQQKASDILNKNIKINNPEIDRMKRDALNILNLNTYYKTLKWYKDAGLDCLFFEISCNEINN